MIPGLKVISPGLMTSVQDLGRRGHQAIGVPVCGPMDRLNLVIANALVGNPADAPALEMLVRGAGFEVLAPSVRVAVAGAGAGLVIEGETRRQVPSGRSVRLTAGQRFRVGEFSDVACAYLAVEGGVAVPPVLGSAATFVRNRFGGIDGRPLAPGDVVPVAMADARARAEQEFSRAWAPGVDVPIRVVLGPQDDYFTEEGIATLLSATFTISQQADRMGFRLDGPPLQHKGTYDIVSDGIVTGCIQVPGNGLPIVLLADAQTAGGYPKIATVISADVPVLARRKSGAAVRFTAVTQAEAEQIRREQERALAQFVRAFRPVQEAAAIDEAALYNSNLVGGVADALDETGAD